MRNKESLILIKALEVAAVKHHNQIRKGTQIPYIVHPMEVALILQENGANYQMIAAGLLHDVLEDGEGELEDNKQLIKNETNEKVLEYVIGLSEELKNRKQRPWEERKQHTIDYLKKPSVPLQIKLIACADKLSNARSMQRDYETHGKKFWDKFNAGYEKQKKYYKALVESLKELHQYDMYKEFKEVVNNLFSK